MSGIDPEGKSFSFGGSCNNCEDIRYDSGVGDMVLHRPQITNAGMCLNIQAQPFRIFPAISWGLRKANDAHNKCRLSIR